MENKYRSHITQYVIAEKNLPLETTIGEACRAALQPTGDKIMEAVKRGIIEDNSETTQFLGRKPYPIKFAFGTEAELEAQSRNGKGQPIYESTMDGKLTAWGILDEELRVIVNEALKDDKGKAVVQACHAAVAPVTVWIKKKEKEEWGGVWHDEELQWIYGTFTKDVREASRDQIGEVGEQCFAAGIAYSMRTESVWCMATQPINKGRTPPGIKKLRRYGS